MGSEVLDKQLGVMATASQEFGSSNNGRSPVIVIDVWNRLRLTDHNVVKYQNSNTRDRKVESLARHNVGIKGILFCPSRGLK